MRINPSTASIGLASFLALAANGIFGSAYADECSPLYKIPEVKKVVDDHVARVVKLREKDPSVPYNVEKNIEVLTERTSSALRTYYVDNPAYNAPQQDKKNAAVDAALGFGLNVLVECFPSYKRVYASYIAPVQNNSGGSSPAELNLAASSAPKPQNSENNKDSICAAIFPTKLSREIALDETQRLARKIDYSNTNKADIAHAISQIRYELYHKVFTKILGELVLSSKDAEHDRVLKAYEQFDLNTARLCIPNFASIADQVEEKAAQNQEREIAERKAEAKRSEDRETAELRERETKAKAFRERQEARQREEKTPEGFLKLAYQEYMVVQSCYKARQGYRLVYLTDQEMEEARSVIKQLEAKAKSLNPGIDDSTIWKDAASDEIISHNSNPENLKEFNDTSRLICNSTVEILRIE